MGGATDVLKAPVKLATEPVKKAGKKLQGALAPDIEIPAPPGEKPATPMPNPQDAVRQGRKKAAYAMKARQGRASTMMSNAGETLG